METLFGIVFVIMLTVITGLAATSCELDKNIAKYCQARFDKTADSLSCIEDVHGRKK